MASKSDTPDHTQDFLKALLRRAGGERFDIQATEVEEADDAEVEVTREKQNPDADPDEEGNVPEVLVLRKKSKG